VIALRIVFYFHIEKINRVVQFGGQVVKSTKKILVAPIQAGKFGIEKLTRGFMF
jgi:hypothetical protein